MGDVLSHSSEILIESATHTASVLPVLFAAYLFVEFVAHGRRLESLRRLSGRPIAGAITASALGLLPQCGFASAATVIYLDGLIPRGTLIASYIATSDEGLPILLSRKESVGWVVPLLLTKFVWGAVAGAALNLAEQAGKTVHRRLTGDPNGAVEQVQARAFIQRRSSPGRLVQRVQEQGGSGGNRNLAGSSGIPHRNAGERAWNCVMTPSP